LLFLSKQEVLDIHAKGIAEFGGSLGLRDGGALESALAAAEPAQTEAITSQVLFTGSPRLWATAPIENAAAKAITAHRIRPRILPIANVKNTRPAPDLHVMYAGGPGTLLKAGRQPIRYTCRQMGS
jgi:hypothetical protein